MSIQFKEGVQLTITATINKILSGVHLAYMSVSKPCVVTSGTDGHHMEGSKHYSCEALDFRTFNLEPDELHTVIQAAKNTLGKDFDVVIEHDHLHVEYDPKAVA